MMLDDVYSALLSAAGDWARIREMAGPSAPDVAAPNSRIRIFPVAFVHCASLAAPP